MKKRIKILINGVERVSQIVDESKIPNMLKRKWISAAIKESNQFDIHIFPSSFVEEYTRSGWSVAHEGDNKIIKLKDCTGSVQVYDINKLIDEKELNNKNKQIDLLENVIEQARLIFLTGKHKSFECAFNHIENRIKYEKLCTKNEGGKK